MSKILRNDPCPCGSGEKYKKCCIDKILSFPTPDNFNGEKFEGPITIINSIRGQTSQETFSLIDELNMTLEAQTRDKNSSTQDNFLGLSPEQMHIELYSSFNLNNQLFSFECADKDELREVPFIKQSLFLMNRLKEVEKMRATQQGNLPKAFVIELYNEFFSKWRYARMPHKEDDLPQATRLKHILDLAGIIKKRSGKFSLTKKGISILEKDNMNELFEVIFLTYVNKWNWAYSDGYPDFPLIQQSASFNIYLVLKKCQEWTLDKELGQHYLEVFPALAYQAETTSYSTPEDQSIRCFTARFLSRFCFPLGLLELKDEKIRHGHGFFDYYKVSSFFKNSFKLKI